MAYLITVRCLAEIGNRKDPKDHEWHATVSRLGLPTWVFNENRALTVVNANVFVPMVVLRFTTSS